jgi:uncharacterized protein YcaQ
MPTTVHDFRRFAVTRSLFVPGTLQAAIDRLGFVQADPIRAPARAQDLTLRHRVAGYRAGDLERLYDTLDVEEDVFVNYGFVSRTVYELMHPRRSVARWGGSERRRVGPILEFVRRRGVAHPRDVDRHFARGRVTNYWGGSSNATTHLLDLMHYQGLLRIVRRDAGVRIYAARPAPPAAIGAAERDRRLDALVDVVVRKYAPLPAPSLSMAISRLRYGVPQWRAHLRKAVHRAKARLAHADVEGVRWYWPAGESGDDADAGETVRLLAPFDPIVWDRRRFELLWGWPYRFEAYTPAKKRVRGYYALPLMWRDRIVGWANVSAKDGAIDAQFGYVAGRRPADRGFKTALDAEMERMRLFLVGVRAAAGADRQGA